MEGNCWARYFLHLELFWSGLLCRFFVVDSGCGRIWFHLELRCFLHLQFFGVGLLGRFCLNNCVFDRVLFRLELATLRRLRCSMWRWVCRLVSEIDSLIWRGGWIKEDYLCLFLTLIVLVCAWYDGILFHCVECINYLGCYVNLFCWDR